MKLNICFISIMQILIVATLLNTLLTKSADAYETITLGRVYPVIEENILTRIKNRAASIDWDKVYNRKNIKKKLNDIKPGDAVTLPKAFVDRVSYPDMSYKLDHDIINHDGTMIYPKGYTFNPMDFIRLFNTYVVISGNDKHQIKWWNHSKYISDKKVMLIVTEGPRIDMINQYQRPVYYLKKVMANRFKLKAAPSIITQVGRLIKVQEIALK